MFMLFMQRFYFKNVGKLKTFVKILTKMFLKGNIKKRLRHGLRSSALTFYCTVIRSLKSDLENSFSNADSHDGRLCRVSLKSLHYVQR